MADQVNVDKAVKSAARGALLGMLANASLVLGIPLAGFFGADLVSTLKANTTAINEIKIALVGVSGTTAMLNSRIEGLERSTTDRMTGIQATQMSRFDAQGRRIEKVEGDVDRLKERVWSIPSPPPPALK